MKLLKIFLVISFSGIALFACDSPTSEEVSYSIGDTGPAGGYIFYDDEADGVDDISGTRYLEAAPEETESGANWGGYNYYISEDDGDVAPALTGIGEGYANTEAIVRVFGETEPNQGRSDYAAKLCWDLEHGGYDDWYLPSKDELNLLYTELHSLGYGEFKIPFYWSSSEESARNAWIHYFADGENQIVLSRQFGYSKNAFQMGVRAIRAF